jgi:hypothetical protein
VALEIVDYRVERVTSIASQAPNTLNTVTVAPEQLQVPNDRVWRIDGVAINCNTPGASLTFSMFDQDPSNLPVPINSTVAGFIDTDNSGFVLIQGGDRIWLRWNNVPQHAICRARLQIQVCKLVKMSYAFGSQ